MYQTASSVKSEGDNIYYYLSITNYDKTNTQPPPQLSFIDTRTQPILNDAGNYRCCVQKLYIETNAIPLFIPIIKTPVVNINETVYSFTMTHRVGLVTYEYQQFLIYSPQNINAPLPNVGGAQDLSSDYYYVYQIQYFTKLLNTCLSSCFDGLSALLVANGHPALTGAKPKLEFNIDNSKYVLFADQSTFDESLANPVYLYMNSNMNHLLSNFQTNYLGYNVSNGKNFRFLIYNTTLNIYKDPPVTYLQMYQEISGVSLFNSCGGLVLSTSLLPIRSSLIGIERGFGGDTFSSSNNNSNTLNMITDFTIASNEIGGLYRPFILYQPSPNYKWLDLLSNNSINNVNINVFFRDNFNRLVPLYLPTGSTANITLLFRNKNVPALS